MNDKEKNEKAIDFLYELIGRYKDFHGVMVKSDQPSIARRLRIILSDRVTVTQQTIYDLEGIKKILEE